MIHTLIKRNYTKILKASYIVHPNLEFYNKKRVKYCGENKRSYEGYMCCGITSYMTSFILHQNQINHKVWLTSFGYGKYLEDHVHIETENNIIIDTSFKQFFNDYRGDGSSQYEKYLYEDLDPFFVGTRKEFYKTVKKLKLENIKCFGKINVEIEENYDFWNKEKEKDISDKMDLYDYFNSKKDISNQKMPIDRLLQFFKENT
jgi:hypothetical protein